MWGASGAVGPVVLGTVSGAGDVGFRMHPRRGFLRNRRDSIFRCGCYPEPIEVGDSDGAAAPANWLVTVTETILKSVGLHGVSYRVDHGESLFARRIWVVSTSSQNERWVLHFTGHVQGVGFRYNTHRLTRDLTVTGFVRNLMDGRVELVAEGPPAELASLRDEVQRTMANYIREVRVDRSPATGEFSAFEIRC